MSANVIAFAARTARAANTNTRYGCRAKSAPNADNVIALANWLDRARPRRTPTGVFFTTGALVSPGQIA